MTETDYFVFSKLLKICHEHLECRDDYEMEVLKWADAQVVKYEYRKEKEGKKLEKRGRWR
jgi:hypothetical protein